MPVACQQLVSVDGTGLHYRTWHVNQLGLVLQAAFNLRIELPGSIVQYTIDVNEGAAYI